VRLFDLVLAIVVLLAIVAVARREFPRYAERSYAPVAAISPSPAPTP
jgi:hypothetical protein